VVSKNESDSEKEKGKNNEKISEYDEGDSFINYKLIGRSSKGLVRENNEDSFAILNLQWVGKDHGESFSLGAVADGVGGMQNGEVASSMSTSILSSFVVEHIQDLHKEKIAEGVLKKGIEYANKKILEKNYLVHELNYMATTLSAILLIKNKVFFAHSGDCSIYVYGKKLRKITVDHRETHSNRIYSCLGTRENFQIDTGVLDANRSESLLVASDGLTDLVDHNLIEGILDRANGNKEKVPEMLIDEALKAGGIDNVTVLYGFFE
jgi:protein phosphatase